MGRRGQWWGGGDSRIGRRETVMEGGDSDGTEGTVVGRRGQ